MTKVGAPYGNRNAEKWTLKKAVQLFHDAIDLSNEKETSIVKVFGEPTKIESYKFDFIGEISGELGTFKEIFNHLYKRFNILKRLNNVLHSNIERNCYYNGKKGAIKEASAIMNLKSNHKWTDRIDQTTKDKEITKKNIDLSKLTEEELRAYAELQSKLERD